MWNMDQAGLADLLRGLHRGPQILVIPNAWDAASARVFEDAGFSAVATSSAGIAYSLGYLDGQRISRAEMAAVVSRLAAVVRVPVSADMEAGYGASPADVAETVRQVLAAGAVGMNLEDAWLEGGQVKLAEISSQQERIRAAREAAQRAGIPLVLNARTDVYLRGLGDPAGRFEAAVARMNAYLDAGADCAFVPGVRDAKLIAELVQRVRGPLNVLASPGAPSVTELQALGVARVSLGAGPMRAALGATRHLARELRLSGTYDRMSDAMPGDEVSRLFEPRD
jgi:2-methylisocitrate lyase-like PEP mutase family enzyme